MLHSKKMKNVFFIWAIEILFINNNGESIIKNDTPQSEDMDPTITSPFVSLKKLLSKNPCPWEKRRGEKD